MEDGIRIAVMIIEVLKCLTYNLLTTYLLGRLTENRLVNSSALLRRITLCEEERVRFPLLAETTLRPPVTLTCWGKVFSSLGLKVRASTPRSTPLIVLVLAKITSFSAVMEEGLRSVVTSG